MHRITPEYLYEFRPNGYERNSNVRIHEINNGSIFPVVFTYDYLGYRSMVFHNRKSRFSNLTEEIEGW